MVQQLLKLTPYGAWRLPNHSKVLRHLAIRVKALGNSDSNLARMFGANTITIKHMKTIGLIGGMSWESTVPYYRVINETVNAQLGGLHASQRILYNVDFLEIEELQR